MPSLRIQICSRNVMAGFHRAGFTRSPSDPRLSFRLAQEVPDLGFRQTLLTMRSEAERMRRIADFLPGFLERRKTIQHTKDVAGSNGHAHPRTRMSVLIFDADDTLWENNIYFEQCVRRFRGVSGAFLADAAAGPRRAQRNRTGEFEDPRLWIASTSAAICSRPTSIWPSVKSGPDDLEHVMSLAERILRQPIELIEGVEETLEELSQRHKLALFTKGHPDEQRLKVDRSGLGRHFSHTAIVKEKDSPAYSAPDRGESISRGAFLDDRQFAQVRHQPRARSGSRSRAGAARAHLGAGASGTAHPGRRAISDKSSDSPT